MYHRFINNARDYCVLELCSCIQAWRVEEQLNTLKTTFPTPCTCPAMTLCNSHVPNCCGGDCRGEEGVLDLIDC